MCFETIVIKATTYDDGDAMVLPLPGLCFAFFTTLRSYDTWNYDATILMKEKRDVPAKDKTHFKCLLA